MLGCVVDDHLELYSARQLLEGDTRGLAIILLLGRSVKHWGGYQATGFPCRLSNDVWSRDLGGGVL